MSASPRRHTAPAVVLGILAVLATGIVLNQSTASGASPRDFSLRFEGGTFRYDDVPPLQGPDEFDPSPGDSFVLTNPLFRGNDRVGRLAATCVVVKGATQPENARLLCHGVYTLPGGTISGSTTPRIGGARTVIAITGGTGRYVDAGGVATERSTGEDTGEVHFDFAG
jgi:hypothetical protein